MFDECICVSATVVKAMNRTPIVQCKYYCQNLDCRNSLLEGNTCALVTGCHKHQSDPYNKQLSCRGRLIHVVDASFTHIILQLFIEKFLRQRGASVKTCSAQFTFCNGNALLLLFTKSEEQCRYPGPVSSNGSFIPPLKLPPLYPCMGMHLNVLVYPRR